MEEYDEDLSENPWYLAFAHSQSKLFAEITAERWIVCVPKYGSWKGDNDVPKTMGGSNFQSHCMKYDGVEIVANKPEKDAAQKKIHRYVTHNGKLAQLHQAKKMYLADILAMEVILDLYLTWIDSTLLVEGSRVTCGPGFEESATSFDNKSGLLDLPPSGLNHQAKIIFEETYFNANDQSYKMLCISRPLEVHLALEQETGKKDEPVALGNSLEKMPSSHLWNRAYKPEKVKKSVDSKIANYIKLKGAGKTSVGDSAENRNTVNSLNLTEITGIDACEADVNSLFKACVEILKKDSKIRYLLQELYGSVSRQIASSVANQEAAFNKKICNLFDVRPKDLEIDERYWLSLSRAKRHISKINKCCTPYDKLACIQRTVSCITAKQDLPKDDALGSDDLLPILIYLVIKSGIPNWITNLVYLKRFELVPSNNEQSSYLIATMEAAIEHINSSHFKLRGRESPVEKLWDDHLLEYFEKVRKGDVDAVRSILSASASNSKERESKMCHPLCDCGACAKLKRSISITKTENLVTVFTRNEKGQTALHVAALLGRHELVDMLLEHGAEINATDYHGSTPLHCATLSGSQSVVFLLLHHGANQSAKDNNNNTPLHLCCQRGHETCAKAILYYDPTAPVLSVNMDNDDGDTPLHVASKWGYVGIVSALIESGADPNAINRRRQSTVDVSLNENVSVTIKSAANQVIKIVRTLKYLQANKHKEIEDERTPEKKTRPRARTPKELNDTIDSAFVAKQVEKLFRAVNDNDLNMVRYLCGWEKTDAADSGGQQRPECHPLCQCQKCQPLIPEHVLHANSANDEKYTGLMLSAKHGFLEMTELFLQRGASPNNRTKRQGYSALHFACESGNIQVLKVILEANGSNADIRDENGNTPLYVCSINNLADCASILMEHNASLNIRNRNGDTPLHIAVKWKNRDVTDLFLQHGALMYYKNNEGRTPLDLADQDPEIKDMLLQAESDAKSISPPPSAAPMGISPHTPYGPLLSTDHIAADQTDHEESSSNHSSGSCFEEASTPPVDTNLSISSATDNLLVQDTCGTTASEQHSGDEAAVDCRPKALLKIPSVASDIFCEIGTKRVGDLGLHETAQSDCETETDLLLHADGGPASPPVSQTEAESSSKQEVNPETYFEMG